jgi:hypothetical protein
MRSSSPFTRCAVIVATTAALSATPALAREADLPLRPDVAATQTAPEPRQLPARVDGMGVQPQRSATVTPAEKAVPLTKASPAVAGGGVDWLLALIGGTALVGLLSAGVMMRSGREWNHPFRAVDHV